VVPGHDDVRHKKAEKSEAAGYAWFSSEALPTWPVQKLSYNSSYHRGWRWIMLSGDAPAHMASALLLSLL